MNTRDWLTSLLFVVVATGARAEGLGDIRLPPGFAIERLADVPEARAMTWSPAGTLFVAGKGGGVYALTGYGRGPLRVQRIVESRPPTLGVAFHDGDLYFSEVSRILRLRGIEKRLADPPAPEVVYAGYPDDRGHGGKFIAFGPDGKLYVPVGAPCNICQAGAERYAVITRLDVRRPGAKPELVARGVRNTVGFDWQPHTRELWFTDNGRDQMGDDLPPDELNRLMQPGQHFGYPFCHGKGIRDPEFGKEGRCENSQAPAQALDAHGAALGMRFYTGRQFPAAYRNSIFIAQHGSWNRSRKSGYRVLEVRLDNNGKVVATQPFAGGWLDEASQRVWGRPADVSVAPDGALLVSDDYAGAIYRISYRAPAK
jgi:glucose/arabinose dehydrogenase